MDETSYIEGQRSVYLIMLREALRGLGGDEKDKYSWAIEREEIVSKFRTVCDHFNDNDWDSDSYLPDIIEKHIINNLD